MTAPTTEMIPQPIGKNGICFEDILLERRNNSDLRWFAKEWKEVVRYKYSKEQTKKECLNNVATSERVLHTISQLVANGHSRSTLETRVAKILEEMSHNFNIGTTRKLGLLLLKIMKSIYGQIFVNASGIKKLQSIMEDTPVVLLPSHRSYADFLLVTYVAFHYNLPLPVIAAGIDFMSMAMIGDMLRGCGAFYIKRTFVDDDLYWAVFQEYVKTLLADSGQPLEFFLEGTRSRSGKSLPPKKGLLCTAIESWLRGKVPDLIFVPISISYNRTLEEKLYAYELLGVPKPKESTSGLLKAMKILREDFGDIYMHIGEPISLSQWMRPKIDRHLATPCPTHLSTLTRQELDACDQFSLYALRQLQNNCIISIWSLVSAHLLRALWRGENNISFQTLCSQTLSLTLIAKRLGANIEKSHSPSLILEQISRSLSVHCSIVSHLDNGDICIHNLHHDEAKNNFEAAGIHFKATTIKQAIQHIFFQHYVNQTLHIFIRPALVVFCLQMSDCNELSLDELLLRYSLLTKIFSHDFVFERDMLEKDMMDSLEFLSDIGECKIIEGVACLESPSSQDTCSSFLLDVLKPFILCYQGALSIVAGKTSWENEASLVSSLQPFLEESCELQSLYSALSLDTCRHAVKMLLKMQALERTNSEGRVVFIPSLVQIDVLKKVLGPSLLISTYLQPKL